MQIAAISDLHLGCRDEADLFGHSDSEFVRFLRFLEANFERIVLVGDIWETLTSLRYGDAKASLRRCREAHPEIAKRFESAQYTFVHGNHDIVAADVENAPEDVVIDDHGTRVLFTHGHQSDPIVRRAQWLSELGVWAGGWIRRARLRAAYKIISKLDRARGGVAAEPDRCRFQRFAVGLAHQRGADVVVTGHTHVATKAEHGDRLFLNGGSCANACSFASLDTRAGRYETHSSF